MAKERRKLMTVKKVNFFFRNYVQRNSCFMYIVYIILGGTMEPYSAGFDYKEPIDEKTDVKIAVEEWQLIHVKEAGS